MDSKKRWSRPVNLGSGGWTKPESGTERRRWGGGGTGRMMDGEQKWGCGNSIDRGVRLAVGGMGLCPVDVPSTFQKGGGVVWDCRGMRLYGVTSGFYWGL